MERKYQVFISSTYDDLKNERRKVQDTILSMYHFPIGMEMFSAADEEQWEIIQETIDSSDYYVLIIGHRYGSVIQDGEYAGMSYTQKEFRYALEKKIPVLAFLIDNSVPVTPDKMEEDADNRAKLEEFKKEVMQGRLVQWWTGSEDLANKVMNSLNKMINRGKQQGWIRADAVNLERTQEELVEMSKKIRQLEEENKELRKHVAVRKPNLWVEIKKDRPVEGAEELYRKEVSIVENEVHFRVQSVNMCDAQNGIIYRDFTGTQCEADFETVRMLRYICLNGFPLMFYVNNDGNVRATGVRVRWKFPESLQVIAVRDLIEYISQDMPKFTQNAYENWDKRFFGPDGLVDDNADDGSRERFISLAQLRTVSDIANLLDPSEVNEVVSIFAGDVRFEKEEVKHKDADWLRGVYIVPTEAGEHEVECEIICNEYEDVVTQKIKIVVD